MIEPRTQKMSLLTVVAPIYNEEGNINLFYNRLKESLEKAKLSFEVIFVNDGSKDQSLILLLKLANEDKRVKVIDLSRNFGHQLAVTSGLANASGDAAVIIDTDLQDPPELIPKLVQKWQEGYDIIDAKRKTRQDKFFKKYTALLFYKILNSLLKNKIPENVGDFRLIDRVPLDILNQLPEQDRYLRGLSTWIGFEHTEVLFDRDKRFAGETGYTLSKMMRLALDAIFSFSSYPLKFAGLLTIFFSIMAVILMGYALYGEISGNNVPGWTSQVIIMLFFSIAQLLVISIISEYVARIYVQVQGRPLYIIGKKVNFDGKTKGSS